MAGKQPDYNVHAMTREGKRKGKVGVAWMNDDGTIGVVLDPYVVLKGEDDLAIRLFHSDYKPKGKPGRNLSDEPSNPQPPPCDEKGVPF